MAKLAVSRKGGSVEGNFVEYIGYGIMAMLAYFIVFPDQAGRGAGRGVAGGLVGFVSGIGAAAIDAFYTLLSAFGVHVSGSEEPGGVNEGPGGDVIDNNQFPPDSGFASVWNLHRASTGSSGLYFDSGPVEFVANLTNWTGRRPDVASQLPVISREHTGRFRTSPPASGARGAGLTGTWDISPDIFIGTASGAASDRLARLKGDIRALVLFVSILQQAGIRSLGRLECYSSSVNHQRGKCFDWYCAAGSADERSFEAFLHVCYTRNIPIAWISPVAYTSREGKRRWPMFQVRNGKKVRYASSPQNHSSPRHYHIDMPRIGWYTHLLAGG